MTDMVEKQVVTLSWSQTAGLAHRLQRNCHMYELASAGNVVVVDRRTRK